MFKNLKLTKWKGLNECELTELGSINVICGKNNSGKSTVLEAISKQEHRLHGLSFSEDLLSNLHQDTLRHFGFKDIPQHAEAYKGCLETTLQQNNIWYEDQFGQFRNELYKKFVDSRLLRSHTNSAGLDYIKSDYTNLFSKNIETILIPPKRKLDLTKNIQANESESPDGTGILNRLFFYRNQPDGTDQKNAYDNIAKHFLEISNGYSFGIHMNTTNTATLNFSNKNNEWVSAGNSGLGLQDLLVILWFAADPSTNALLIEEPESHIHPEMQRKLLEYMRGQSNKQFFLSTHSNIFLNSAYVDRIFFTQFNKEINVFDATSRAFMLNDLGYSVTDNLVSDLVILVEGPSDAPVIEEFLIKMGVYSRYNIKIWPLGGDIMDQLDLSIFTQNHKLISLIDNDPLSNSIRKKFTDKCADYKISLHKTERYSIENYFSLEALREVFKNQIDSSVEKINPNEKLEKQIGINVKKNNRRIAQAMTLADIAGTDLEQFLNKVVELCKS